MCLKNMHQRLLQQHLVRLTHESRSQQRRCSVSEMQHVLEEMLVRPRLTPPPLALLLLVTLLTPPLIPPSLLLTPLLTPLPALLRSVMGTMTALATPLPTYYDAADVL